MGTYALVGAAVISLFYSTDPGNSAWGANRVAVLKYLPLELAAVAFVIYVAATPRPPLHWTVWCYQALFAFMLVGSLLTLAGGASIEDSFLGRTLGLLVVYPAYRMFSSREETIRFARPYRPAVLAAGIVITVMLAVWQSGIHFVDQPHIFHEEVLIPAAGILVMWVALSDPAIRGIGVLFLLAGVVLTKKNTGFLAAICSVSLISLILWRGRVAMPRLARVAVRALLVAAVASACAAVAIVVLWFADLLPSGSPRVRVITYAIRLGQFLGSPLLGQRWIGTPLIQLSPTFREPSHSDVLDILAFGGIVGLALFASPLIAYCRRAPADLIVFAERRHWLGAFFLAVLLIFVIQMFFNPMWNQPELVLHFWLAVGFCAARAERRRIHRPQATSGLA